VNEKRASRAPRYSKAPPFLSGVTAGLVPLRSTVPRRPCLPCAAEWHFLESMLEAAMTRHRHVKLFRNGRNQAVRIPVEFERPGRLCPPDAAAIQLS
jgi:hypothetical protein